VIACSVLETARRPSRQPQSPTSLLEALVLIDLGVVFTRCMPQYKRMA
jgi:hypothetical protein